MSARNRQIRHDPSEREEIYRRCKDPIVGAAGADRKVLMNKIQFEKPDLTELKKNYTVVDLHVHSCYSDGKNSIREIADRAKELGIGIAVTDHNEIRGAVEIDAYREIMTIPGIEITSREGTHVLVYFYDVESLKWFYRFHVKPFKGHKLMSSIALDIDDLIHRARLFKTLVIFPHPYSSAYIGVCNSMFTIGHQQRLFELSDGVEAINSENLNKWNLKCSLLGFNLNKAVTGGSDGHNLHQIGSAVSFATCKNNRESFLDAVKSKQNMVVGKEIDLFRKVKSNGYKLKTNLKNYPDLVEKNFKYGYTVINTKSRVLRDNIRRSIHNRIKKSADAHQSRMKRG